MNEVPLFHAFIAALERLNSPSISDKEHQDNHEYIDHLESYLPQGQGFDGGMKILRAFVSRGIENGVVGVVIHFDFRHGETSETWWDEYVLEYRLDHRFGEVATLSDHKGMESFKNHVVTTFERVMALKVPTLSTFLRSKLEKS